MADPKYANLPGIASPDEKDVYETDDLPEADQDVHLDEAESEFIERPVLNVRSAHEKFRGKGLEPSRDMDFSDAARRRRNVGYSAVSGEWEIEAQGDPETLLQRRNRLQAEFKVLIDDINQAQKSGSGQESGISLAALVPELESSLLQLSKLDVTESNELTSAPGHHIQNILKMINELNDAEKKKARNDTDKKSETILTYTLNSFPAHTHFSKSSRIADLELRLNDLETVLGTTPDNLRRMQISDVKSVGDAVHDLSSRVNLLDLSSIDAVDGKLANLLSKMDAIVEKRGGPQQVELESKVNELYESYHKVDTLAQSILPTADRLAALTTLNQEAAEFKKTLLQLKLEMKNMSNKVASDEATAASIREGMQHILQTVTSNIEGFNKRLATIKK